MSSSICAAAGLGSGGLPFARTDGGCGSYVTVNTNRYSVPVDWIGRRVEVRETGSKIEIQLDARHLITHQRMARRSIGMSCWPNTGRREASSVPILIGGSADPQGGA